MTLEVHPVADLFPMLADDELRELADDIKQRGLLQPVVLDSQGRVLDGRNRLAACRLAGVEPEFRTYDGDDPDGYALAVNGQRREMTKAQKAVVAAKFSRLEKYGDQRKAARALGVSDSRVSEARLIAEYHDLADVVLAGTRPFTAALDEARKRDQRAATERAAKNRLRLAAPDLAAHVDEERISLDDAIAALDAREQKARDEEDERRRKEREDEKVEAERRERHTRSFAQSLVALWSLLDPDPIAFLDNTWDADANPHRTTPGAREAFTGKGLLLLAERLTILGDHVDAKKGLL